MERDKSAGLRFLTMLALAALPELACCHLAARALPPLIVCAAEGRLPDPTDCRYYVDCTSNGDGTYSQTITPCPDGTYYDSCQGDCSITVQPPECSVTCDISDVGTATASSNNPSLYFVCISNATASYLTVNVCPNGTVFHSDTNSCWGDAPDCPVNNASPGTSKCNGTYYYGDEKNCSVYYYCSHQGATPDQGQCDADQYFITYNHSCVEFNCVSEGYFADPASCSSFYYCASDYTKAHGVCQSGYHFDSSVGQCLLGDCTTVCPGSSRNFTCPSSGIFADPLNCSWYYICDTTLHATHVQCPAGSHFDSAAGGCLMGECSNTGTDFTCPSSGSFADPLNCIWYYICDTSLHATHVQCPAGSHFDSAAGGCLMGECSNTGTDFTCPSSGSFADSLNCSWYYICDTSLHATHVQCPAGSHFDSAAGGCLMGECSNTGTDFTCPSSGLFPDPLNCSSFYYCDSSLQATHNDCPAGSHFDITVGGCLLGECSNRLVAKAMEVGV